MLTHRRPAFERIREMLRFALSRMMYNRPVGACIAFLFAGHIPNWGVWVKVPPRSPNAGVAVRILIRRFEMPEVALIRARLRSNLDVVELGSGVGVTAAHILAHGIEQAIRRV